MRRSRYPKCPRLPWSPGYLRNPYCGALGALRRFSQKISTWEARNTDSAVGRGGAGKVGAITPAFSWSSWVVADEAATAAAATFFLCCIQHLAVCLPIIVLHCAIRFVHPGTGHERPYERGTKSTAGGGACVCFFPWMWERASFKSAGAIPSKEAKILGHWRCSRAWDPSPGLALPFCLPGLRAPHTMMFS